MDDSQSPPEAESSPKSGKADAARRTTLRLRDAEIVATTRRDMFGDGSLLDALAGDSVPREGEDPGLAADTTVSAEEAEPQPADPEAVADEPPQTETPVAPDAAVPAAQAAAAEAEPAQSLDAIIDSFPAGLASQTEEQAPPEPQADDEHGSEEAGFASDKAPPTAPERFQVSAIFEGLASSPPHAEEPQEEAEGDASQPEGNEASGEHSQEAAAPRPPAVPTPGLLRVPVFFQPPAGAPEPSGWPPLAAPAAEDAPGSDTGEPPEPSEPSSGPHQDAASTEPAPYPEPADWSPPAAGAPAQPAHLEPARKGGAEPFPEPLGWPPYLEPPGYQADSDAPLLEPPSLVGRSEPAGGASSSPFPGTPAWPPFPEAPGSEPRLSPPEPAGLPPYIELPAHPEGDEEQSASSVPPAEPQPPDAAPPVGDAAPVDAPPFAAPRGMPAVADRPAAAERQEVPGFPDYETSTPAHDAAARDYATSKIAAEANATAQVLDNLQRLLDRTVSPAAPQPQQSYAQAQPHHSHNAPFHLRQDEPMPSVRKMASRLPLRLPPPPWERTGNRNVYLLGFLTGLLLSVMAGAALYFLINTG